MATVVTLLQLSPTMSQGTLVKWQVKEGAKVSSGDILAEIETDKAVMEQESFEDGTVLKLVAKEGQAVPVGSMIAVLGEPGEDISGLLAGGGAPAPKAAAEPAPAKPAAPAPAPAKPEPAAPKAEPLPPVVVAATGAGDSGGRILVSPLARKMAAEHGIDLAQVAGSGPNGRIVKRDIETAVASGGTAPRPELAAAPAAPARAAASAAPAVGGEEIPLSGMRKTIARRLVESRQQIPSFSLSVDVDAQPVLDAVARMRERFPEAKVTVTHFLIKAMASALMNHPWLRTQWVDGRLVRKHAAHVSVAVAIDEGLLTPVIRNANAKGLQAIAAELRELAARARDRKLTEEDLTGGVQTISNLGMFGIQNFDAIINPPEASILAVGAVIDKPVVRNGNLVAGKIITLTLSCDHRVVDGAVGASYLKDLKAALEDPLLMLA
ncbi:MAG: 2-oxo acid dehydrogenase subunit E2 [Candidatus Sumerlaeia bacterium]|nr:2-oxo acid dehydrogenase subunit E2 [Candidatus Sumerlaeia bacterium]